jgi:hypothetical protein
MSGISPEQKKDPQKKKEKEQGLKSKRGKTSFEKLHVSRKKKGMRSTSCWRDSIEKERKEITFFL